VRYLLLELAEEVVQLGLGGRRELLQSDPLARYRRRHLRSPETRWHTQRNQDQQPNSAAAEEDGGAYRETRRPARRLNPRRGRAGSRGEVGGGGGTRTASRGLWGGKG
jgi:hypothetical protein